MRFGLGCFFAAVVTGLLGGVLVAWDHWEAGFGLMVVAAMAAVLAGR